MTLLMSPKPSESLLLLRILSFKAGACVIWSNRGGWYMCLVLVLVLCKATPYANKPLNFVRLSRAIQFT